MVADSRCATDRELRLLIEQSNDADEAYWMDHVEHCEACRSNLTEMAASPNFWDESRDHLRFPSEVEESHENEPIADADRSGPTTCGHYTLEGVIGFGGMATVHKGFDPSLHRAVAIKILHPHLAKAGASRKRFLREAQSAASITHPNVIPIYGVHHNDGKTYLVMPYIAGGSLQQRIDREGPLPVEDVLKVAIQIAEALSAAHAQGVIHRDIKPANILLEDGNKRVVLSDFGLARTLDDASLTASGLISGTPAFMSPEQANGEDVDARTDLYSLGSVLYCMFTAHPPYQASSSLRLLRDVTDSPFPSVSRYQENLPAWIDQLIARLVVKDKGLRIQSAAEAVQLIRACLLHVSNPSNPLPEAVLIADTNSVYSRSVNRKRIVFSWGVLGLAIVCTLAGSGVWYRALRIPVQRGEENTMLAEGTTANDALYSGDSDVSGSLDAENKKTEVLAPLQSDWDEPVFKDIEELKIDLDQFMDDSKNNY